MHTSYRHQRWGNIRVKKNFPLSMLTLAHIFISFCDCLQCDRQWCGQGTEVLNAPLESNCWTSLSTCGAHFLPSALLYSFQYRPVGWLGGDRLTLSENEASASLSWVARHSRPLSTDWLRFCRRNLCGHTALCPRTHCSVSPDTGARLRTLSR